MKTLGKTITSNFFTEESGFEKIQELWRNKVNFGIPVSAEMHMLYAILRGKNWRKGFVLPKNEIKLNNGALYNSSVYKIIGELKYRMRSRERFLKFFNNLISEETLNEISELLPHPDDLIEGLDDSYLQPTYEELLIAV